VHELPGVPGLAHVTQLAEMVRGGFVESRHFGLAVALDPNGSTLYAAGAAASRVLPRSTAKPLQAVGAIAAGADLDPEQAAVAAGSHTGEDYHVFAIDSILRKAGLDRTALGCPSDWPEDEATRRRLMAAGRMPEQIRMNCSGKHAAMLAATVSSGGDPRRYLDLDNPVQRRIQGEIDRMVGEPTSFSTLDGCGAPMGAVSLTGLARAFSRLATAPEGTPDHRVADAMRTYPHLVGGDGHANTELMRLLPGLICKGGAEGVLAMAAPTGHAVAVKVIDGSPRATTAIGLALLERCGFDVSAAKAMRTVVILGGARPVGAVQVTL
jgi:L-asparaginase II